MRVGDLVALSPAPLDLVAELPEAEALATRVEQGERLDETDLDAWLARFLIASDENRFAVSTLLESISGLRRGPRAFLVRGVYGTGKTHLLGVLRLLGAGPRCWTSFLRTHPEFARHARAAKPLLAVTLALDHFDPRRVSLEDLVVTHLRSRLAGMASPAPEAATSASRAAVMAEVEARAAATRRGGVLILLDELGLFLAGRPRAGRNADAGFLQFLGQRAQRAPLWVVGAVQRQLDDTGGFDPYALEQLRDRFRHDLTLSMSNLHAVLRARLPLQRDAGAGVATIHRQLGGSRLAFTADDLRRTYPLNPFAFEALEGMAAQHGSRTRGLLASVLRLAAPLVSGGADATHLVTTAEVFTDLRPLLETHGELQRAARAWRFIEHNAARIWGAQCLPDVPHEQGLAAVQSLLLAALSGSAWTVDEVASSLAGGSGAAAPSSEAVTAALEAARRRGAYVRLQATSPARFVFDVRDDLSESLRQRILERVADLVPHDPRLRAAVLAACRDASLPLGRWLGGRVETVWWQQTRRPVCVVLADADTPVGRIAGWCAQAERPGGEFCAVVAVIDPLTRDAVGCAEGWTAQLNSASRRLVVWAPAPFSAADVEVLHEATARCSLLQDTTLAQTRTGRALRPRLEAEQPEWDTSLRRAVERAYAGGRWWRCGAWQTAGDNESAASGDEREGQGAETGGRHRENCGALLEAAVRPVFAALYPQFGAVAPRRPLASDAGCRLLLDRVFARGERRVVPGSSLAAYVTDLLEPLGLASLDGATVRLADDAPVFAALNGVPARCDSPANTLEETLETESAIGGALGAPPWGVPRPLAELVVAAAVRAGVLVGLDGYLRPVPVSAVASPLPDYWPRLARARALPAAVRVGAARAAAALLGGAPPRLDSVTEQAVVWERLRALPATRAAAWGAGIESIAAPWPAWNALQPQIAVLESLQAAARRQSCVETGLCALGEAAPADWEALASLVEWLSNHLAEAVCWQQRLESAHSDEDTALEAARAAMWAQFANSPVAIRNWTELSQAAEAWRAEYAGAYACWHGQVFSPERRAALSALRAEPATPLVPAFGVVGALRPLVADAQAALERAEGQWCAAVGTTGPLTTAARCECGLRLDEDRAGLDAAALRAQRDAALAAVRAWLLEPDRAARLRRRLGHAAARPLYQALGNWAARGEAAPLAALLPDAISVLQAALEGEPAAARPVTALAESLRGRELSVTAAREVFTAWLDPDSSLRAGDLVRME